MVKKDMAEKKKNIGRVPVEVSARHVHLCREDLEKLFGKDFKLRKDKSLSQPGEFASKETVDIVNPKNKNQILKDVRVLGPVRNKTQIEISLTDAYSLGVSGKIPIRLSGDIKKTPGVEITNPKNNKKIKIKEGLIVAKRHLHLSKKDAEKLGINEENFLEIEIPGKRNLVFKEIIPRIKESYRLALHLDSDEGNAAGIRKKCFGRIKNIK